MTDWSDAEVRELVTLWPKASAAQIARCLHRPRAAICGKIGRLRQDGLLPYGAEKHLEVKPQPDRHVRLPRATAEPTIRPQKPLQPNLVSVQMRPCSILELDDSRCHWPLGDVYEIATAFCGGLAVRGCPYCPHHSQMARGHDRRRTA
jgi:GcrA cell cycle regulator